MAPVLCPKQSTLAVAVDAAIGAAGCVSWVLKVAWHPPASVTVTE